MPPLRFTKMEGLGNDYVYVDGFREKVPDPAAAARRISDRRFGVGSDGLILIQPPTAGSGADVRMEMYNADGSRSEMCGNGIRCVAKYAHDHGIARKPLLRVETDAGVKVIDLVVEGGLAVAARVDMGPPRLERAEIPMQGAPGRVVGETLRAAGRDLVVTCLSMGNPHCVVFVDDPDAYPVAEVGPAVENHPSFPRRTNVEFVRVVSPSEIRQRTWERGSGETFACGTGACAVAVAAQLNGLAGPDVTIHLRGGDLRIEWDGQGGSVFKTGPAVEVFSGEWLDPA
jgi:diaminopimelate epimerase